MSFAAVLTSLQQVRNPFPGLRPFETDEAHLFFGRDQQVSELVDRLERRRLVAVIGLSGCGKSSLVRAGLIPALRCGSLAEANARWKVVVMRPAGAPFASLKAELERQGLETGPLRQSSHGLIEVACQLPDDETMLLVVDQFEELFRYKERAAITENRAEREELASEAAEFVRLLLNASSSQLPVYIVLTMRSDYIGDCAEFRDFPETLNECQYLVPRMTREQRKQAIEGPLGRVKIAPSLVQRILNDAGDDPGQLPVLQHALMRTWEFWRSDPRNTRDIGLEHYRAAGGFEGALNQHADELLERVDPVIAEKIFRRLTKRGPDHRERRDPATVAELWAVCGAAIEKDKATVCAVLDEFRVGSATFLVPRAEQRPTLQPEDYVDIAHESLIWQWGKMREWIAKEAEAGATYVRILDDALAFRAGTANLWRDPELALALSWWASANPTAAWARRYSREPENWEAEFELANTFLEKSRLARDAEIRKEEFGRKKRAWLLRATTVIALAVAAVFLFLLLRVKREHERNIAGRLVADALSNHIKNPAYLQRSALYFAESTRYQDRGEVVGNIEYWEQELSLLPNRIFTIQTDGPVLTVGTTMNGAYIGVGSWDGTIRVLKKDGATVKELWKAKHNGAVWSSNFSDDGRFLAAGDDQRVRIYNVETGKQLWESPELGTVWRVVFGPKGLSLAAASQKGALVYDGATGAVVNLPHDGAVDAIAFNSDGTYVVTGSEDNTVRLFQREGTQLWKNKQAAAVRVVSFSPDGKLVAAGSDDGATRIYNQQGREIHDWLQPQGIKALAFSPDAKYLATGSEDGTARVLDVSSANEVSRLEHGNEITSIIFSRDGRYVLTASDDRTARLFEALSGRELLRASHGGPVMSAALSGDAKYWVTGSMDKTAVVWDTLNPGEVAVAPLGFNERISEMAVTFDGHYLATIGANGTARVLDLANHSLMAGPTAPASEGYDKVGISSKGRLVAAAGSNGIAVLDTSSQKWTHIPDSDGAKSVDVTPAGSQIAAAYTADTVGGVYVFDVHTRKESWHNMALGKISQVLFSPSGRLLAAAGEEDKITVFTSANGTPIATFTHRFERACKDKRWMSCGISALAFSLDDRLLATASNDNTVRIYDLAKKCQVQEFFHQSSVNAVTFSPDGLYLASASDDMAAHIFELSTGRQISTLILEHGDFFPLGFSADDRYIFSASDRGTLRVTQRLWQKKDLLHETCTRVGDTIEAADWKRFSDEPPRKTCTSTP